MELCLVDIHVHVCQKVIMQDVLFCITARNDSDMFQRSICTAWLLKYVKIISLPFYLVEILVFNYDNLVIFAIIKTSQPSRCPCAHVLACLCEEGEYLLHLSLSNNLPQAQIYSSLCIFNSTRYIWTMARKQINYDYDPWGD